MKLLQDDSLIRRAAAQDAAAFEQLMLLHQKPVYNICWRMTGNAEDALDLSQEVFLKLWRTLAQYQFDAAFSTWLYRLTQNVCIDFLRKQKRQQHVSLTFSDDEDEGKELSVPDPEPLPEERVIFNEKQEAIRNAMTRSRSISAKFWSFAWCGSCRMSRSRRSWIFQSGRSSRVWRVRGSN